jgi:hypothetical protein
MERRVASSLNTSKRAFESSLEWLITWKIKQSASDEVMWCDGVFDLEISQVTRSSFTIKSSVYIGPESNVKIIKTGRLAGTFTLSSHRKRLKRYNFTITEGNHVYVLSKKT